MPNITQQRKENVCEDGRGGDFLLLYVREPHWFLTKKEAKSTILNKSTKDQALFY